MKLGFSFSPGGLLSPYHVGVLAGLEYNNILDESSPLAGSSAGAIAVVSHACGIDSRKVLEATIKVSDTCETLGGARGRLLPLLRDQMEQLIDEEAFERLQSRTSVGVAYRELFPKNRSILQTSFQDRNDMMQAVCHSCMFPFFATNFPVAIDTSGEGVLPRVLVDGFFSVPRDRFGCPDFSDMPTATVDRTITVSPFPHAAVRLLASEPNDRISPAVDTSDISELYRLATQASSKEELTETYERGWGDAEAWIRQEQRNDFQAAKHAIDDARRGYN